MVLLAQSKNWDRDLNNVLHMIYDLNKVNRFQVSEVLSNDEASHNSAKALKAV